MGNYCYIRLTSIFQKEENGTWTAECKELGTATFGDSFEDAEMKLQEAIELHLNTLEEIGERERFFTENKIKIYTVKPPKSIRIDFPIDPNANITPSFSNTIVMPSLYPIPARAC